MADIGTGTTIAFGTSSFSAELLGISQDGMSRPAIDTSHMGTSTWKTFMPGDLVDNGEVQMEIAFNPDNQPPISAVAETITITFPVPAGSSSGATAAFSGFVTDWGVQGPLEERMTSTITIKVSGQITWTDAS